MTHCFPRLVLILLLTCAAPAAWAKPLLTDSQATYASACLDDDDTAQRMVQICELALQQSGASAVQRSKMLTTLAWALYELDRDAEAEAVFARALELDTSSGGALRGLGWMARLRDDHATAVERFQQAVAADPNAQGLAGLGSSLVRGDQASLAEGLQYLDTAVALDPDYSWAMREKGWLQVDANLFEAAADSFRQAIAVDADDAKAHYGAAFALSELDLWAEALEHVNRTLDLTPDHVSALSRRSLILLYLGRAKQALRDAEEVIAAWPDDSDGYVRKARALRAMGQGAAALELLEQTDNRLPPDPYLIYWRADMLYRDDRNAEALTQIDRALQIDDSDHYDHTLRTRIALDLDDLAIARQAVDNALRLRADDPWVLFYDALVMVAEDQFDRAEARFDAAHAAGLSQDELGEFLRALAGKGRYMQAIQMRVRYSDMAKGE